MRIAPSHCARLIEVRDYRPRGPSPVDCVFKDEATGRALVKRGWLDVSYRRMKLAAMKAPADVYICWVTDAGLQALADSE